VLGADREGRSIDDNGQDGGCQGNDEGSDLHV
jgi:hypothetical protein